MSTKDYTDYIFEFEDTIEQLRCVIQDLTKELGEERELRQHYESLLSSELDHSETRTPLSYKTNETDYFMRGVDELIETVKDDPDFYEWDRCDGSIYEMILYLVRCHMLDDLGSWQITEKV